ncbi:hypothetical protein AB1K70_15125 [Bremerella sp. JC770]|uniref:hypothetical protein n=1 Tax=Bremerella sp. JC770 TaxID=3232137 RepID=UPI0034594820
MKRPLRVATRRGQVPVGTILMMAGVMDIILAAGLWFVLGQGDMVFSLVFGLIALSGLGLIGFGVMKNVS